MAATAATAPPLVQANAARPPGVPPQLVRPKAGGLKLRIASALVLAPVALAAVWFGAPFFPLYPDPSAPSDGYAPYPAFYDRLRDRSVPAQPLSAAAIGDMLRHALGLSAWKCFGPSRWPLRVNPSSGNEEST